MTDRRFGGSRFIALKKLLQYLLCLTAALHLAGGHWGVLQMVAWAQMLRSYTEQKGLVEGVKETFDGDHPCPLCRHITEARQKEEKQTPAAPLKNRDQLTKWFSAAPETGVPAQNWSHASSRAVFAPPVQSPAQWAACPPGPPPRAAA